jgi:hypothetical protein
MNMFFFLTRLPVVLANCGRELLSWAVSEIERVIASLAESCYTAAIHIPWALASLASSYFSCTEKKGKGADKVPEKLLRGSPVGRRARVFFF